MPARPPVQPVDLSDTDRAAAHAAGLHGRRLLGLDTHGGGTAVLGEVSASDMLKAWRFARDAVEETGRWPVLVAAWLGDTDWEQAMLHEDPFDRFYFREGMGVSTDAEVSPPSVLAAADRLDLSARLAGAAELSARYDRDRIQDTVDWHLSVTQRFCGRTPDPADVLTVAAQASDPEIEVERMLMDWEDELGFTSAMTPPADDGYLEWFTPTGPIALALLPTTEPASVHAFVSSLYAASSYGQDLVVATMRRWHQAYAAVPVALWGTIVEMVVSKPPTAVEDAWELACQQAILASDTLDGPGITRRQHARALLSRSDWFLHSRP